MGIPTLIRNRDNDQVSGPIKTDLLPLEVYLFGADAGSQGKLPCRSLDLL